MLAARRNVRQHGHIVAPDTHVSSRSGARNSI
jgi:hypothetical protein